MPSLEDLSVVELALFWQDKQDARLALDRQSKAIKKEEDAAKELLIRSLRSLNTTANIGTHVVSVNKAPEYVPHVMDWTVFYQYIIDEENFAMLEKRPGRAACQELWDAGITIPGVEKYPVYKLSVTKL